MSGESWDGGASGTGSHRNSVEGRPSSRPRSFEGRRNSGERPPIAPTTPSGGLPLWEPRPGPAQPIGD